MLDSWMLLADCSAWRRIAAGLRVTAQVKAAGLIRVQEKPMIVVWRTGME